jgi:hypothetical protein
MQRQSAQLVPEKALSALVHLEGAYQRALDLQIDPWQLALSLPRLAELGVFKSDLRWLSHKGYVESADECTTSRDANRQFSPTLNTSFSKATCFVLTTAGLAPVQANKRRKEIAVAPPPTRPVSEPPSSTSPGPATLPHWDGERRVLRVGEFIVKQFRCPAQNQEAVLAAFQEEGWPNRITDPMPPTDEHNPKSRVNYTIRRLNENQVQRLVRFFGDGSGQVICWELLSPALM